MDQAEQMMANQSQVDVAELRRRGQGRYRPDRVRAQLRDQVLIGRLHERRWSRIRISDQDIDRYLQEQQANTDPLSAKSTWPAADCRAGKSVCRTGCHAV